jgi:ABC-2 type transport system permease protein
MIDGFRAGFTGHADGGITTGILVLAVSNLVLLIASWRMLETGYKLKS